MSMPCYVDTRVIGRGRAAMRSRVRLSFFVITFPAVGAVTSNLTALRELSGNSELAEATADD